MQVLFVNIVQKTMEGNNIILLIQKTRIQITKNRKLGE